MEANHQSLNTIYTDPARATKIRTLLVDLFESECQELDGVNALRFRARHDEDLMTLDDMRAVGWIEQQDRFYRVTLVGVAELSSMDKQAAGILDLCQRLFYYLRDHYKRDPERNILVTELGKAMQFPVEMIRKVLLYLRQTAMFGGSSIDLSQPDAYVLPSEEIIRRKSFDEILQQHLTWIAQRFSERDKTVSPTSQVAQAQLLRQAAARPTAGRPVFRTPFETYNPIKQIGQGGSGYVWSAKDEAGETVAVKYVDPGKLAGRRGVRFRNEVRFGQRANHPNIVPVLDLGETSIDGTTVPFFVMPFYELTLRRAMQRGIPHEAALPIFEKILAGLEAAHDAKVWHRDLKPENILLSADLREVRIADFGIAHFEEADLYSAAETKAAERLANFNYSAPEQRDPMAPKDHRMDIFALGLILNELFTGHVPHGAGYRKIDSVNSNYAHLDSLVDSMIRQRAEDRPQSVAQVRSLLIATEAKQNVQESSTVFFSRRFGKAFPGVRGIEFFRNPSQARERLEILLAEPLILGTMAPIWWWRSGDLQIETVQFMNDTILIDGQELVLDWIAAVNARSYYQQFVYVQSKPETPSGLYDYSYVDSAIRRSGFASEEFALYQGHYITRAEYDDGAAVIDGKPVAFDARPELRTRFLTPYNLLIAPHGSPINNAQFDKTRDTILNRMLRDDAQLSELVDAVLKLPKRPTG